MSANTLSAVSSIWATPNLKTEAVRKSSTVPDTVGRCGGENDSHRWGQILASQVYGNHVHAEIGIIDQLHQFKAHRRPNLLLQGRAYPLAGNVFSIARDEDLKRLYVSGCLSASEIEKEKQRRRATTRFRILPRGSLAPRRRPSLFSKEKLPFAQRVEALDRRRRQLS
jgi:hypothetical protein